MKTFKTVDEYIKNYPKDIQKLLTQMRETIKKAAPKAEEGISYGMPAYKQAGVVCYFGGFEKHIGFYPTASGVFYFNKELEKYHTSKGAIQLPLNTSIPVALITKIVRFKVKENIAKGK